MMPSRERLLILTLTACQFTILMDFVIIMPLGARLMRELSIQPHQFSAAVSSYGFAAAITGLISALFIDRFDRRTALLCAYAGFTIGTLGCGLARNYDELLIGRMVAGGCSGLAGPLIFSIIGDQIPYERRGAATGAVMSAFSIASFIGVPAGLLLANHHTWNAPFYLLTALCALAFLLALTLPKMTGHLTAGPRPSPWQVLLGIFGVSNHLQAFAMSSMMTLSGFMVISFFAPFMVSNVGLREDQLPLIYVFGGLCTAFSNNIMGYLTDRFGKLRMFLVAASVSLIPVLVVTHLHRLPLAMAYLCSTLFMILVSSRFVPMMAMITAVVVPQKRGGFMSINSSLQSLAMGLGAFLAGSVLIKAPDGSLQRFDLVGYLSAGATLVCMALALRVRVAQGGAQAVPAAAT
jgi:predicted MFS family arabinose efflux permease